MANKDDYLTEYRRFFEHLARTINPRDQLPVKLAGYKLVNVEVVGGIIDWTSQYLAQKKCPPSLVSTLIRMVIDETRKFCKQEPIACGFNPNDNAYEPLKLMQTVISITCEVCLRYLDNSKLCSLPAPSPPYYAVSAHAVKNRRRRMEDRHVIIHDLSSLFLEQEATPSSYYAIFDGHAGHDAATYSCAHLHQFLGESKHFISNPEQALREAFYKTDALFLDKCKVENLSSGTTALCALIHQKEKLLYIAWVGDSQAILVRQGHYVQCVQPHMPSREDEKKRVEADGGVVLFWDTWRVNGQLSVSRAIGDSEYKPYVTAVPDIVEISLNGTEDFLILACDGLWDAINEDLAAQTVYTTVAENPDDIELISIRLTDLARQQGSSDNITVIVVLLRETSKIAAEAAHWANCGNLIMDTLDNANSNPFAINSNNDIIMHKEGLLLDLAKQNGGTTTNGKRSAAEEFDDDDDLGPETDVDAMDDVPMSPNKHHFANITEQHHEEEKATLETEHITKNDSDKLAVREETLTPPADSVHDTSGVVDNVADSCEDSDDEWNYFKGDVANKENLPPSETDKEVCDIIDNEEMSHLNPNAAEFVPLSPRKNTESPALQALRDEPLLARSPKRSSQNVDVKVPDLQEFESEIKSRPSEVRDNNEDTSKLSSEEIMSNLLNGKNIEEIEFRPVSTPIKTFKADDFHFGPNSTFSTPAKFDTSEALSTKAVFGDESTASYLEKNFDSSYACSEFSKSQVMSKEQDPMSASFYHDKDDGDEANPLDLNKVHVLPENIEEFINKPEESLLNDTISDLPEHNPAVVDQLSEEEKLMNTQNKNDLLDTYETHQAVKSLIQDETIQDLLEVECDEEVITSKTPLQSPVDVQLPPVLSQSPVSAGVEESLLDQAENVNTQSSLPQSPILTHSPAQSPSIAQSPIPPQSLNFAHSPVPQSPTLVHSPIPLSPTFAHSPVPLSPTSAHSPLPPQSLNFAHSPVPQSPTLAHSPVPQSPILARSPAPAHSPSIPQSPLLPQSPVPVQLLTSVESSILSEPPLDSLQSPLDGSKSPFEASQLPLDQQAPLDDQQAPLDAKTPLYDSQASGDIIQVSVAHQSHGVNLPVQVDEMLNCEAVYNKCVDCIQPEKNDVQGVLLQSPVPLEESLCVDEPSAPAENVQPEISASHSPVPCHEVESSAEDITSSVKDSPLLASSPLDNKTEDTNLNLVEEANVIDTSLTFNEAVLSPQSKIETESVATTDVNSFLERSLLPDVASPLSPNEQDDTVITSEVIPEQDVVIKSDVIAPEFPVQQEIIVTPTEIIKEVVEKKTPAKAKSGVTTSTAASKKPATKAASASTKPATKPITKTTPAPSKPVSAKATQVKTPTAPVASPKPISKPPVKTSTTNGVAKAPVASTLTKTTSTTSASARPVPSKTAKPPTTRPTTAPAASKPPISKPAATTARPATLLNKTSSTTATGVKKSSVSSTVTNVKSTLKSTTLTSPKEPPKPRSATGLAGAPGTARPKSATTKPLTKAPDTEKSIKEAANKQTASRTATAPTKTIRKVEPKVPATRTSLTNKTTPTSKGTGDSKKPQELVRHPITKTKVTKTTTKETKIHENGVESETVTVTSTTTIEEPQLIIKDVSPIIENSQLLD